MARRHRTLMLSLVDQIVDGVLTPGTRLPNEVGLAKDHRVSRGVAREALRALEERGMVRVRHGSGQTILGEERWNVLDADVMLALVTRAKRTDVLLDALACRATFQA